MKTGGGLAYARKENYEYEGKQYEADLKVGDTIKILNGGETEQGTYGEQHIFNITTRNGDKRLSFNQNTINVLITEFGEDTDKWVDQDVKVILEKKLIAGKKCIVPYLVTEGWSLDDYGELMKPTNSKASQDIQAPVEDVPPPTDKDVKVEDIPF